MLLVFAILPTDTIVGGSNVLSALAESAAGRWLRILVVVDASIVLSAGVLTGTSPHSLLTNFVGIYLLIL
jgi:hypothetical protein